MCVGCFRTIHEISNWVTFSDQQRERVNSELLARRTAYRGHDNSLPKTNQGVLPNERCEQCGKAFVCGMSNPEVSCWCTSLPHLTPPISSNASCLCAMCLAKLIEKR